MTDLDKLVDEIVEIATDESHHIFDLITGSKLRGTVRSALEDAAKQAYHSGFDSGRERGRIEGLKYALNLIDARLHKAPLDIWVELRARIQELEGEK